MEHWNKPELLAPAGDAERLSAALSFGADAVYLGGRQFGMRAAPANFGEEELRQATELAHRMGKKVYLTCNALPRNEELTQLDAFLQNAVDSMVDAMVVADIGVFAYLRKRVPDLALHVSTQAGVVNYLTARTFYEMGASRVVLARELSLEDIADIRAKTPAGLELEAFVHGSMCVSFSGRCLISNYLTGRDANRGDCAQPCRWKYSLVEEKRPNEFYPVMEGEEGTYFFNACDLSMIEHIPQLVKAGVDSFKLEGRAKAAYYTAAVTNAYRWAIDEYCENPGESFHPSQWIVEELDKVSHRRYGTGFFFGRQNNSQIYESSSYIRNWEVAGIVQRWEEQRAFVSQRNRFFQGEELSVLTPGRPPFSVTVGELWDKEGNRVDCANKAAEDCSFACESPLPEGAILRRETTGN